MSGNSGVYKYKLTLLGNCRTDFLGRIRSYSDFKVIDSYCQYFSLFIPVDLEIGRQH